MSKVRVLVGTRKGAFILTSDGKREKWEVSGPHFAGWEMYHLKGSPVDPNRIYASQTSGWFGQVIQRSDDGGKTWHQPGTPPGETDRLPAACPKARATNSSTTPPARRSPRTSGTTARSIPGSSSASGISNRRSPIPTRSTPESKTRPCSDPPTAARTGRNSPACAATAPDRSGSPAPAACACTPSFSIPANPKRIYIAISAAGAFRTDDGGKTWKPINKGLYSKYIPDPDAEVGHCVHHIAMHPSRPGRALHAEALGRHAHRQRRRQVARSQRQPAHRFRLRDRRARARARNRLRRPDQERRRALSVHEGKLRVYRSRTGGNEWEPLTKGLPQENCYVNVLRDAMAVDTLDDCGIYFGTTGGQVYVSPDAGDSWQPIVRDLPAVLSVEVQTIK